MLGRAAQDLVQAPGRGLQFYALVSVTFGDLFAPHKQPGPGALRAGVATPHPPGKHRDRKQAKGGNNQQGREQNEILRPESRAENMKFTFRQVPQDCLTAVPIQPDRAKKQQKQQACTHYSQGTEQAGETAGVNHVVAGLVIYFCGSWSRSLK